MDADPWALLFVGMTIAWAITLWSAVRFRSSANRALALVGRRLGEEPHGQ